MSHLKTSCDDVSLSTSVNRTLQLRRWLLGPGTVASCAYSWTRLMHCKPPLLSVGVCKIEGLIVVHDQSCSLGTRIRLQMLVSPSRAKFVGKWFSPETLFICRPDETPEETSKQKDPNQMPSPVNLQQPNTDDRRRSYSLGTRATATVHPKSPRRQMHE